MRENASLWIHNKINNAFFLSIFYVDFERERTHNTLEIKQNYNNHGAVESNTKKWESLQSSRGKKKN